jgi:hypothetical protein
MSLAELREAILRGATTSDLRVRRSDEEGYRLPAEHPELADLYQGDGGDPNSTSAATPRALRRAR